MAKVAGFSIPRLFETHDELLVIEIEIVNPPYVLDFASAYLDEPPPSPPDMMIEIEHSRRELFEDDWPLVASVFGRA